MHRKLFFTISGAISDRITETFNFVWATAAAQWNLRWQVDGFLRAHPTASSQDLKDRFSLGSGINGADLKTACIDTTWGKQQEMFAKILLIEFCALYEAWLDGALEALGKNTKLSKDFQFPSSSSGGVSKALTKTRTKISPEMLRCIYPTLASNKKNSLAYLENLLICYRFFKECRNTIIHHNSQASQKAIEAYSDYAPLSASGLGLKEKPRCSPIHTLGEPVNIDLRGVVGFGDVVLRIISTLDAELSQCEEAEKLLAKKWVKEIGRRQNMPNDQNMKIQRIGKHIKNLGLETPIDPLALIPLLQRNGLILPA